MLTFLYKRARPSMADVLYSRSCLGRNRLDAVESRPRPLPSYFRQPFMRVCSLSPPIPSDISSGWHSFFRLVSLWSEALHSRPVRHADKMISSCHFTHDGRKGNPFFFVSFVLRGSSHLISLLIVSSEGLRCPVLSDALVELVVSSLAIGDVK